MVDWCKGEVCGNSSVASLVSDIRQYLSAWEGFEISFVSRNMNSFADTLAKNGSSGCKNRLEWGDVV